jgi:DNA invertase Pin-like site-specific DNA recombinase
MNKRVAIYARVSTANQDITNQLIPLQEYANKMNYQVIKVYSDDGISGSKSRIDRPSLDLMLKDATKGHFNKILCYDISRLGRNIQHLITILNDMQSMKCNIFFLTQGIDTQTVHGKMIFSMMGVLAEWERGIIQERINAGITRARCEGKKLGRPSSINDSLIRAVRLLREKGLGIRKIATELKIDVSTTMRIIKQVEPLSNNSIHYTKPVF